MRREELSGIEESVASLFKVSRADSHRRLVRYEDPVDWELLTDLFDAFYPQPEPVPDTDPLALLLAAVLRAGRPDAEVSALVGLLAHMSGGWVSFLTADDSSLQQQTGLTAVELGAVRTILRVIVTRLGGLSLAPLADMTEDRALGELVSLPGVSVDMACWVLLRAFERPLLPPTPAVRRVLTRMGVLGLGLSGVEALAPLRRLPSGLPVETLFTGLSTVAGRHCLAEEPNCAGCPLHRFCALGQSRLWREPAAERRTMVDLFAGAGGMSHGLAQVGFRPVLAVERDRWACRTYQANHPDLPPGRMLQGDIQAMDPTAAAALLGGERPDLLVGGPPCQGFSLIGKRGRKSERFIDDPRNRLYKEFIRWIEVLRPRLVVMENVPGLYSYKEGAVRTDVERNLKDLGYAVGDLVVDASRFGVPQRRQRVLFIGAAVADYGNVAEGLTARIVELLANWTEPEVSLEEAIGDLPALEAGGGREVMMAQEEAALYHHVARPVNLRDKLLYGRLKPGQTGGDAVANGLRHLMVYRNDVFQDKYRRLRYDEPSPTIMSHLAKDGHMFIHPKQRRSITVREAARIQSFPDDFLFVGSRTHQYTQVGNAVPPRLARAIGQAINQALSEGS